MEILPTLVHDVLDECSNGKRVRPSDLAIKYGVGIDTISHIRAGHYDHLVKITGKVRLVMGKCTNEIRLYDAKGYVPSGKSIAGALELSQDELSVKCHECGGWFEVLSRHIKKHNLTSREYKIAHKLKMGTCLMNEPKRIAMSERFLLSWRKKQSQQTPAQKRAQKKKFIEGLKKYHASRKGKKQPLQGVKMAHLNSTRRCPVQAMHDFRTLVAKTGKYVNRPMCKENGINFAMLVNTYGSLREANRIASGVDMKPPVGGPRWYTDSELIGLLREFGRKYGRTPSASDCKRGLLPTYGTYRLRIGWEDALAQAGFNGMVGINTKKPKVRFSQFGGFQSRAQR